jgi:two-component system CheB/CheR fusion protein
MTILPPPGLLAGLKLLLVDDAEDMLDTLALLFEMEGAEVSTASNGREALARLSATDFDILISDLGMPVMDGYTLMAHVRHGKRNADIPAIALSGYGYSQKADLVGYTDQVCKPVSMDELMTRLAALATLSRSRAAMRAAGTGEAGD